MGFGTLFIGYFLLLNLTYHGFTDIIAASVMLLGLYKLSKINKYFSLSVTAAVVFLVFSLAELGVNTYMFLFEITPELSNQAELIVSIMSVVRSICIGALTFLMLKGIEDVAREVDVENLPTKASRLAILTAVTYTSWIILEGPLTFINEYVLGLLSLITFLVTLALIIVNLTVIYTCYMRICMPGDENIEKDKPSKFAFVNEYRARKAERDREMQEKRAALLRERAEKKKGKKR